jgi:hypothetical protein
MSVCAQTSTCPTCGQFETAHVSLCHCPPLRRLADQVSNLTQRASIQADTIAAQHEHIASLSRQLLRLARRLAELEEQVKQ